MQVQKVKSKKTLGVTLLILLLAVISASTYYWWGAKKIFVADTDTTPSASSPNLAPPNEDQKRGGEHAKSTTIDQNKPSRSSQTQAASTSGPLSSITVDVTTKSPYVASDSVYQIRTLIQKVTNTGTCTLKLTSGVRVVTKTTSVQALSQYSTCKGFDIPKSELSPGIWNLNLTVDVENYSGSTSGIIQVQ